MAEGIYKNNEIISCLVIALWQIVVICKKLLMRKSSPTGCFASCIYQKNIFYLGGSTLVSFDLLHPTDETRLVLKSLGKMLLKTVCATL